MFMYIPNSQANQVVKSCMQPAYITFFQSYHAITADRERESRITEGNKYKC